MISASTRNRITRPMIPVILKSVSMRSAFGDPPLSGENVSASAGTAATSRKMNRFERKAGATIRVTPLGPREGSVPLLDEREHSFAHVISAEKLMLDVGLELEL